MLSRSVFKFFRIFIFSERAMKLFENKKYKFFPLQLTSGFYVHNIAAQLQNAHEILIVMGYVNIDDTTLKLLPNLNYNNLKAISRDCYIASQECLVSTSQPYQHSITK